MPRRDDITLVRTSGITVHLRVTGETMTDMLQDLAVATVPDQWTDAIDATYYINEPADYDLSDEQAIEKLDAALDELARSVVTVSIALSPEQAEDLYQRLGEVR